MRREKDVLRSILSQSIRTSPTSRGEPLRNKAVASHRTPKGAVRLQYAFGVRELARAFPRRSLLRRGGRMENDVR